jgi:hypothetical protein
VSATRSCAHCGCRLPTGSRADKNTCDGTCRQARNRQQSGPVVCSQCLTPLELGRDPRYRHLCSDTCVRNAEAEGRGEGRRPGPRDPYVADPLPSEWKAEAGDTGAGGVPGYRQCQCGVESRSSHPAVEPNLDRRMEKYVSPPHWEEYEEDYSRESPEPRRQDLWPGMHMGGWESISSGRIYAAEYRDPVTGDWKCSKCGKYADDSWTPPSSHWKSDLEVDTGKFDFEALDSLMRRVPVERVTAEDEAGDSGLGSSREEYVEGGIQGNWDFVTEAWRNAQTYRMGQQRMADDRGRFAPSLRKVDSLLEKTEGAGGLTTRAVPCGVELAKKIRRCVGCGDYVPKGSRKVDGVDVCDGCQTHPGEAPVVPIRPFAGFAGDYLLRSSIRMDDVALAVAA